MAILDAPPGRVTAGDTWAWAWSRADYPASAGWTLSWRVLGAGVALNVTSAASGDRFVATASATATAALTVGARGLSCTLIGWVSLAGERFEIYRAPVFVAPNPATASGDVRGSAALALEAVDAMIAGRASKDQQSYRIGDRELSRIPIGELLQLRDHLAMEARRESDALLLASGRPRATMIYTRMGRA